ncbi:protein kri1 [Selaginella moellendorffii]|nr:protein kri1 [Selaginella moellendorffii]|eukprot:XP_024522328.1 protein kri1 [Selaginella moellendorffii]
MAAKLALLDDGSDGEAEPTLRINEEYAKRLEHNKRREDLQRLQELRKRGLVDTDSSSEEDEDEDEDGVLPEKTEVRILETLARIKKKDPSIYKPEVKFFEDDGDEDEDVEEEKALKERKKPVYLKDVVAKQALENPEGDEDEEDGNPPIKTYAQEQQELKDALRKSFAAAVEDDDDEEGLFTVRKKSKEELRREEEQAEKLRKEAPVSQKLEEYFGKDDDLDEKDRFLKNYLQNQGWIDKNKDKLPSYEDVIGEVSEEEEELDDQDRYESLLNFRFEEGGDSQVLGHSRVVEDSVRKISEKRKERRRKKQERLAQAELARQEEVKRLKNVKKKEMMEKLSKIQTVAGIQAGPGKIDEGDLEEDFDPDEHDRKMQQLFGEDYYNDEDPDFHSGDGEAAGMDGMDFDEGIEKSEDEGLVSLDYEDKISDMPTRFKYAQVRPNRFGLSTAQILDADEKELNQYVSVKAMAPYRTEEWIPRGKYHRLAKKAKKEKQAADEGTGGDTGGDTPVSQQHTKKKKKKQQQQQKEPEAQAEEAAVVEAKIAKKEKRKVDEQALSLPREIKCQKTKEKLDETEVPGEEQALREAEKKAKKEKQHKKVEGLHDKAEEHQPPRKKTKNEGVEVDATPGASAAAEGESGPGKKKRRRKKQGLNMSQSRLLSYGKIDLPKKKRK